MKRLALAFICLILALAPAVDAKMTEKKARRLQKKWSNTAEQRKDSYFKAAGRYMYWTNTVQRLRKADAPKTEIKNAKEKKQKFDKLSDKRWSGLRRAERRVQKYKKLAEKLSSGVHAGKGWGGSEGVADAAKRIARRMGIPVTSQKRSYAETIAVGSTTASDHYVGNTTAFAVDFGVSGSRGTTLARRICQVYKLPTSLIGTFNGHIIRVDGKSFRIQLLWTVAGHYDHVHIGIRRQ